MDNAAVKTSSQGKERRTSDCYRNTEEQQFDLQKSIQRSLATKRNEIQ